MANINIKTYTVKLTTSKTYQVLLYGFQYAATLLFNIIFSIPITFVASLTTKFSATINVKKIRLVISKTSLIQSVTQTISSKRINITFVLRERVKLVTTVLQKLPISYNMKLRQKLATTVNNGLLGIVANAVVAQFFTLGTYDPDTLLTMDTQTLGDLDYVII